MCQTAAAAAAAAVANGSGMLARPATSTNPTQPHTKHGTAPTHLHGLQVDALGAAPHHPQVLHGRGAGASATSSGGRGRCVKASLLRALAARRRRRRRRGLCGRRGRAAATRRLGKQALR